MKSSSASPGARWSRARLRLLRRPAGCAANSSRLRRTRSTTSRSGPRPSSRFCTHVLLAMAIVFELPLFVVGLTRLGVLTTDQLRKNRRIGYFIVACIAVALPGVDPVTDLFETVPLADPLRGLDLALRAARPPRCTRRTAAAAHVTERLRRLGAPGRRAADRGRARRLARTAASSRSAAGRAERHYADAVILPGLRQRPLPPRVRGLRRLRRRLSRSAPGSARTSSASAALDLRGDGRDRAARRRRLARAGITTTADYSFSGAAATAAAELGLRAIVYLEVFGADPAEAERAVRRDARRASRRPDLVRIGISPHAPYTCSLDGLPLVPLARHPRRHASRRERERERVARARDAGRWPAIATSSCRRPASARVATLERRARPGAPLRALRRGGRRGDRAARARTTCRSPTARARTPCSAAASRRSPSCAPPASASGSAPTRPASTPSFDVFEELRAAVYLAGRASSARMRCCATDALALATLDAARALGARRRGRQPHARQARRPDRRLARRKPVRSGRGSRRGRRLRRLAGSECSRRSSTARPATAKERPQWQEVRSTASAARQRMLACRGRSPAARRSRSRRSWQDAAVLPAAAQPREVGVRLPGARLRARLRALRRRLRARPGSATSSRTSFNVGSSSGTSISQAPEEDREAARRTRKAWRDLATALEQKQRTHGRRSPRSSATPRSSRRTRTRSPSSPRSTGRSRTTYATTTRRAAADAAGAVARARPSRRPRRRRSARPSAIRPRCRTRSRAPSSSSRRRSRARRTRSSRAPRRAPRRLQEARARSSPNDATTQIQLGQAAQDAGDTATAIAAYKKFLKLAPDRSARRRR